jgi:hypothetical protein
MNLEKLQQNSLAKYLQDAIIKKVKKESWVEFSKEPNQPLSKYKIKKDKRNLLWWYCFSKSLLRELEP